MEAQSVPVAELLGRRDAESAFGVLYARGFELCRLGDYAIARGLEHLIQTPHHNQRKDDFSVVRLLVIPAQKLCYSPNETRVIADLWGRRRGGCSLRVPSRHGSTLPLLRHGGELSS